MRLIFLTAAILASVFPPAFHAPAEAHDAASAAGPAVAPPARQPGMGAEAAPVRGRSGADRCAPASLDGLARRAPFTVFAPRELPAGWVPAVCAYPPDGREIGGLRIHLRAAWTALPPAGAREPRIAGIAETRAFLPRLSDRHGRPVRLRGTVGRFMPWHPAAFGDGRPVHGGILRWIERGTLIEIDSRVLTKKQMIRLAESLAPVTGPAAGSPAPAPDPSAGGPASRSGPPASGRGPFTGTPAAPFAPSAGIPAPQPDSSAGGTAPAPDARSGFPTDGPAPAGGVPFGPRLPFSPGGSILGPGDIRA